MNFKTTTILILAVLTTIIFMQNVNEQVKFSILFTDVRINIVYVMAGLTFIGFVIGFIAGRPKKKKPVELSTPNQSKLMSDADKDYISDPKPNLTDKDKDYLS